MAVLIQLRGGTAAEWTVSNPVLSDRELGFETDTRLYKIGDGVTPWNSLSYAVLGMAVDVVSLDVQEAIPPTPALDKLQIFVKSLSGRLLPRIQGPFGSSTPLQPSFFQNYVAFISTGGTTAVTNVGVTSNNSGAISHPAITEQYGFMANASIGTAAGTAGFAFNPAPLMRGLVPGGASGFFVAIRCAFPDPLYATTGPASGSRIFAGVAATTLPNQVNADAPALDYAGFMRAHTDTGRQDVNWQFASHMTGPTGGFSILDTGLPFIPQKVYDCYLFAPANSDFIHWRIDNLSDNTTAEGIITAGVGVYLPDPSVAMRPMVGVYTVDAVTRNVRIQRIYAESDR